MSVKYTSKQYPYYFLVILLGLVSCKQETDEVLVQDQPGQVSLQFSLGASKARIAQENISLDQIIFTIVDEDDQVILQNHKMDIYQISGSYTSDPISLKEGTYKLTSFGVLSEHQIIYATPLQGTDKDYLVNHPLPITFNVVKNSVENLQVEVIPTKGVNPADFGYRTFSFDLVEPFHIYLGCYTYSNALDQYELTSATLHLLHQQDTLTSIALADTVNTIFLRADIATYTLLFSKEGYTDKTFTYATEELLSLQDSLLSIYLQQTGSVKVFSQQLLFAPLADNSSETFLDAREGITYTLADLQNNDANQQKVDFGYFYGVENKATLAAPAAYPKEVYELNWSILHTTKLKKTDVILEEYLAHHQDLGFIRKVYDSSVFGEREERATDLQENDIIAFKLSAERGYIKGLIWIKDIYGTMNQFDHMTIEVSIEE